MAICRVYLLPEADQKNIIYLATQCYMTCTKISEQYKLPAESIRLFLKKEGVNLQQLQRTHYQDIAKAATEEYVAGGSAKEIAAKYNISFSTVENYMKKHNITYRSQHGRKNFFNQSFFHEITSEGPAYFLGFLFADGSISGVDKNYTRLCNISITVSSRDRIILENFLAAIEGSGNTHIRDYIDSEESYKASPMSTLNLTSTRMADDLIQLGFSGLKQSRCCVPELSDELYRHFVRGYFEGDGCATTSTLQFTGYVQFLEQLMLIIHKQLNIPLRDIHTYYNNKSVGDLQYCKKSQLQDLYHYMYDNCTYIIPRKRDALLRQLV